MRFAQFIPVAVLGSAALATAATWQVVSNDLASVINGVGFVDDQTGFVPAGANGVGAEILKTTDGGATWNSCPRAGGFLLLNAGAIGKDIVVSGVLSEEYSDNMGGDFNSSQNGIQSQCVRTDGTTGTFWVVGESLLGANGVAVSRNGGETFSMFSADLFTGARYGSFPTTSTWYVSAGMWPNNQEGKRLYVDADGNRVFELTEKIHMYQTPDGRVRRRVVKPGQSAAATAEPGAGVYTAQITRSQDGGKTWETLYGDRNSTFYFNGMDCTSTEHCCAVGESDGGRMPGARVYCTWDAGKNWERTAWFSGPQYSLMDIRFISATEGWAAGGDMENWQGYYLHTTDQGRTWTVETVDGLYANSIDFPDPAHGFSTAFTETDMSSVLAFK